MKLGLYDKDPKDKRKDIPTSTIEELRTRQHEPAPTGSSFSDGKVRIWYNTLMKG